MAKLCNLLKLIYFVKLPSRMTNILDKLITTKLDSAYMTVPLVFKLRQLYRNVCSCIVAVGLCCLVDS